VRAERGAQGLDIIVDSLSGAAIATGLGLLAPGGRFIEIGAAGATDTPALDASALFMQSRSFTTVNLGALSRNPKLLRSLVLRMAELAEAQVFRPVIGELFRFEDTPLALEKLGRRENIGKYVVRVEG
jgi:myxalamid-type polyketide synthase MxaE and MxaD